MAIVFTGDILPLDITIQIPCSAHFKALTETFGLPKDGKRPILEPLFHQIARRLFIGGDFQRPSQELFDLTEGNPVTFAPGGSSANTFTTYARATRSNGLFLGVAGTDGSGQQIYQSLTDSGLLLLPTRLHLSETVKTAHSFSFRHTDVNGKENTSYAVYRGNVKDLIAPDDITCEMIDSVDAVFMSGSMRGEKMSQAVFDKALSLRWDLGKDFWFSPHTEEKVAIASADVFQWLIRSANRTTASVKEISWTLLPDVETKKISVEQTLMALKYVFEERYLENRGRAKQHEQIGFITDGGNGAYVVTADDIKHAPVAKTAKKLSAGGGGDAAAAGGHAALDVGLSPFDALLAGQEFSAAKIETTNGPRLEGDPLDHLRRRNPQLAHRFEVGLRGWHQASDASLSIPGYAIPDHAGMSHIRL